MKHAIKILEKKFPGITGIFLFNSAPGHKNNALNASNTNVYPERETANPKRWFVGRKCTKNGLTRWHS